MGDDQIRDLEYASTVEEFGRPTKLHLAADSARRGAMREAKTQLLSRSPPDSHYSIAAIEHASFEED
jgi:hypothetical protein